VERAGLQFIRYQELQATLSEEPASVPMATEDEDGGGGQHGQEEGEEEEEQQEEQQEEQEQEEASHLVENIKLSEARRGTEVKLLGLSLGDNTATMLARRVTVCLQCNR